MPPLPEWVEQFNENWAPFALMEEDKAAFEKHGCNPGDDGLQIQSYDERSNALSNISLDGRIINLHKSKCYPSRIGLPRPTIE